MSWLLRLVGFEIPQAAAESDFASNGSTASGQEVDSDNISSEHVGLHGEFNKSGLAERVALAFDQDPMLKGIDTLYITQDDSTVVLQGRVPQQTVLDRMVSVAMGVEGTTQVNAQEVEVATK